VIKPDDLFKINQRLEIMLLANNLEKYPSRIEELTTQNMIIAMPMSKGQPIFLTTGSKFTGRLIDNGSVYQFTSTFIDKRLQPLPVWIVSQPYDIKKIQQRAFVRIDVMLQAEMQIISDSEDTYPIQVVTKDISGGGVRLVCKKTVKLGTKLQLTINIPDSGYISAISEVVRVEQPKSDLPVFWVGTKFVDIKENSRSKIIKYIFKKQLEQRQKGF